MVKRGPRPNRRRHQGAEGSVRAPKRRYAERQFARCEACKFPTRSDGYQPHHSDCPTLESREARWDRIRVGETWGRIPAITQDSRVPIVAVGTCAAFVSPIPRPDEVTELRELRFIIDKLLGNLKPKEATIVRHYFGLEGGDASLTLSELGQQFGVTGSRINQIKNKALRMLRASGRKKLAVYVGIYSAEDFDHFIASENAAYWAAAEAKRAADREARERAWEEECRERERQQAARERRQARCEAAHRSKIDELLQRLGDEVGPCTKWQEQCRQDVAATLASLVNERSIKVGSEAALFSYFVALSRNYPTRLSRAYGAWMRDVTALGEITFTQGFMADGSFMLYARGSDRCTWYLFDMPDGPRWIGYEDRTCSEVP